MLRPIFITLLIPLNANASWLTEKKVDTSVEFEKKVLTYFQEDCNYRVKQPKFCTCWVKDIMLSSYAKNLIKNKKNPKFVDYIEERHHAISYCQHLLIKK